METFAPDLSKLWLADKSGAPADGVLAAKDDESGTTKAALEALTNLVKAARSTV